MKLVHLAPDPRHLVREVYLIPEVLARFRRSAEGVERRGYDGGGRLLVVEDGERAGD